MSKFLKQAKEKRRYATIYKDLLTIEVNSGSQNLSWYLQAMREGQDVFDKLENFGAQGLSPEESRHALFILKKINTLWEESKYGRNITNDMASEQGDIDVLYQSLKKTTLTKDNQSISDRISEMFLKPIGFNRIDAVLNHMEQLKVVAGQRNRENADRIKNGNFILRGGDLIKNVEFADLNKILDGVICREYLGGLNAGSDSTPYDADFIKLPDEYSGDLASSVKRFAESLYGGVSLIVKNRNQFDSTSHYENAIKEYDKSKYELIASGSINQNHFGVRTGIPSSEIDAIVVPHNSKTEKLAFVMAQKDFYIPVVDRQGRILFSYEDYLEHRKFFRGLKKFNGEDLAYHATDVDDKHFGEIERMQQEIPHNQESVMRIKDKIFSIINDILKNVGVETRDQYTNNILGAEIIDTGSTARLTNMSNNFDFDLAIRIDQHDLGKINEIVEALRERLNPESTHRSSVGGKKSFFHYQFRGDRCHGIEGEGVLDIDIGFISKSNLYDFGTHDAISDKLIWLKENVSEQAYNDAIANIVFTKEFLKRAEVYKKMEENGIGGVGVENWILANGGNAMVAFRSFLDAAIDDRGSIVPLRKFQDRYKLMDPGLNLRDMKHDSYFDKLSQSSYEKMVDAIQKYLTEE